MGIDISARVFYGLPIALPDEGWDEDEYTEGWLGLYLRKSGLNEDDWQIINSLPFEVDYGCAEGCEKYYVYLKAASFGSTWGDLKELSFDMKLEWDEQLKDWCEKVGVEYQQPKWYLTCKLW